MKRYWKWSLIRSLRTKTSFDYTSAFVLVSVLFVISCQSRETATFNRIKKEVDRIWLIDTHEHFPPETARLKSDVDFFSLVIGYLQADMLSSGMTNDQLNYMLDNKNSFEERWNVFYPYWKNAKNTGYGNCLMVTAEGLFGIREINENNCRIIDRKMKESNAGEGWYNYVLKEKCMIDVSIVDPLGVNTHPGVNYPSDFFVKVKRFDNFTAVSQKNVATLGKQYGIAINTLSDYLTVLDTAFRRAVRIERIVGIKSGLAYSREIYYEDVPESDAIILFNKAQDTMKLLTADETRKLADFMFHQIVARAGKYDLPFQIHTGILSRNYHKNPIENTNAIHLSNLFYKYRNTRFVIFHGSFPYMDELTYLAKHYPNVYIDMCWMYIISPSASRRYLEDWLMTVPVNKILAFGGDVTVEWTYGHSKMARQIVTEVLTKMVNEGYFTLDEAVVIAKRLLRDNAIELFKLKKSGDNWGKEI